MFLLRNRYHSGNDFVVEVEYISSTEFNNLRQTLLSDIDEQGNIHIDSYPIAPSLTSPFSLKYKI